MATLDKHVLLPPYAAKTPYAAKKCNSRKTFIMFDFDDWYH